MALSDKQRTALKQAIDARHEELLAEVREDVSRTRGDARPVQPGDVLEPAERASTEQTVQTDIAELLLDLDQLSQIQAARRRFEAGEFGHCVDCGQDIPYERLQAQPAALRCLDCQRMREGAAARPSATAP